MATGRERRQERLNERLRGAQRTNLDDDNSFNLDLAGIAPAPPPTTQPSTSRQSRLNERLRGAQRVPTLDKDDSFKLDSATTAPVSPPAVPAASRQSRLNERLRGAQGVPNLDDNDTFNLDAAVAAPALPPAVETSKPRTSRLNERLRGAQRVPNLDDNDTFNLDAAVTALAPPPAVEASKPRTSRLNERLRGAQRVPNIGDDNTFNLDLAGVAATPDNIQSSSSPQSLARAALQRDSLSRATRQSLQSISEEQPQIFPTSEEESLGPVPRPSTPQGESAEPAEEDEPDALPAPSSGRSGAASALPRKSLTEEVTESPANNPGSGRRRNIPSSAPRDEFRALSNSPSPEEFPADEQSSSPLQRKARRSDASTRLGRPSVPTVPEESRHRSPLIEEEEDEEEDAEEPDHSDEEALEITATEAAKSLGQKRPRISLQNSPDLGSSDEEDRNAPREPAQKRTRMSPAAQSQPKRRGRPKKTKHLSDSSDQNDDTAIEITVQRFVNNFVRGADGDDDVQQEIPFANRGGETVVDVFSQVCEEVIASTLGQLQHLADSADDPDKKKECRIKMRAIAAYKEELNSRLLQHAIHLNHWHSLRRRLRHVQKEKLTLRDEIIRLKREREQVALRMDAIRIKHEVDSKESTSRLNASSLMHDIDLAVERGRDAPDLSASAEKEAGLGNLDLILAQLTDKVSSTSSTGGFLQQVKDFNAFLERAATALESR